MAKGSFEIDGLQNRSAALADTQVTLAHAIDAQSAPAELARRALALGMVPSPSAAFLRLSDGDDPRKRGAGDAKPGFTVATGGRHAVVGGHHEHRHDDGDEGHDEDRHTADLHDDEGDATKTTKVSATTAPTKTPAKAPTPAPTPAPGH